MALSCSAVNLAAPTRRPVGRFLSQSHKQLTCDTELQLSLVLECQEQNGLIGVSVKQDVLPYNELSEMWQSRLGG